MDGSEIMGYGDTSIEHVRGALQRQINMNRSTTAQLGVTTERVVALTAENEKMADKVAELRDTIDTIMQSNDYLWQTIAELEEQRDHWKDAAFTILRRETENDV